MAWGGKDDGNAQGPWGKPTGGGGGKGPGRETPPPQKPDLDELLRKSHDKFRDVIYSGGGGDGKRAFGFLAVGAVALWLASGIYFVKADEQGVILRFGQFSRTSSPGIGYHLPLPIETVKTPRVTAVNRVQIGYRSGSGRGGRENSIPEESLMITRDENIVDINFEVQWKISDAPAYLFNVREPESTVKAVAESGMREVIGRTNIARVLAEEKLKVSLDVQKLMQETLDFYQSGIEVVSVNLLKVDPPAEVIDAFRDIQTAEADMETARNQAEAYRNDILPRANGEAKKMVLDAEAYKNEVVARAEGEASRFASIYAEYKQSKDVTRKRIYLETMEEILHGINKVVLEKGGSGVVPYLPLSELKTKTPEGSKP